MKHLLSLALTFACLLPHLAWAQFGSGFQVTSDIVIGHDIKPADVDGDGDLDLVLGQYGAILWSENIDGSDSFGPLLTAHITTGGLRFFDLADVDDDDDLDLVVVDLEPGDPANERLYWIPNDGTGTFGSEELIANTSEYDGTAALLCHDVTGSPLPEVLISTNNNVVRWFINEGGVFNTNDSLQHYGGPPSPVLLAGDLDLDGDQDHLTTNYNGFIGTGSNLDGFGTTWSSEPVSCGIGYINAAMQLLDVEGDGDLDVVDAMNHVQWAENLVADEGEWGNCQTHTLVDLPPTYGAGWAAHLGCGPGASMLWCVWPFDGPLQWATYDPLLGDFTTPQPLNELPPPHLIRTADLNGDGSQDLILGYNDSVVTWYPNILAQSALVPTLLPFDTLCASGNTYALDHATPEGGIWTGPGVANNAFTSSAPGSFALTYTVADPLWGCPSTAAQNIVVIGNPQIIADMPLDDVCATGLIQCTGIPTGGVWGGGADAMGIIDTDALRPYSGGLTYYYTDATGSECGTGSFYGLWNFASMLIDSHGPYCAADGPQTFLIQGPPNGIANVDPVPYLEVEYLPDGVTSITFDPSVGVGEYPFTATAVAPMRCDTTVETIIEVQICTGLDGSASSLPTLSIFPNPITNGTVRISCPPNAALRLFDTAGRTVWEMADAQPGYLLGVTGFDVGCYVLQAETEGRTLHSRVVIQR